MIKHEQTQLAGNIEQILKKAKDILINSSILICIAI